jgi:hypothetical protein
MTRAKKSGKPLNATAKDGWKKQFVASEPRLSEAVQMYEETGFEVMLEPFPVKPGCSTPSGAKDKDGGECRACFEGSEHKYKIIYTRPLKYWAKKTKDE